MKVSVTTSSIAPHVKQNVIAYYESNTLQKFYTSFVFHPKNKLLSLIAKIKKIKTQLNRRKFEEIPYYNFETKAFPELIRTFSATLLNPILTDRIWNWAELGFDNWVSKQLIKNKPDVIHTYEYVALSTLQEAKKRGVFTIYEQLSQHHSFFKFIIDEQLNLYPKLKSNYSDLLLSKKSEFRNDRRDEELLIADLILCNSTFTYKTLINAGIEKKKIKIIPLGFPKCIDKINIKQNEMPLKFLYAGNQSIRKGTHLLYEAWRRCNFENNEAELWIIGSINNEMLMGMELPPNITIKENIPHENLMQVYQEMDVFILPTLADGFGMVVTEAMSQGIPVITTENSCGPDIIDNGKNGWIIPTGSVEAIVNAIKWAVNNKEKLPAFKTNALIKAKSWQWQDYRKGLVNLVEQEWRKRSV